MAGPEFEVPGWSVGADLVKENPRTPSDKGRRIDKYMKKVKRLIGTPDEVGAQKRKATKEDPRGSKASQKDDDASDATSPNLSSPTPLSPRIPFGEEDDRPTKKAKIHHDSVSSTKVVPTSKNSPMSSEPTLTTLQRNMRKNLDGAKFRMLNEELYKSASHEAHRRIQKNPEIFEEYHIGFRHQVQLWPTNPVEHYITSLSSYPPRTVIADLGCGDAALAKALIPKGLNVLSYDLLSDENYVVEADVFDRIPLPGSEVDGRDATSGHAQVVDVVVCALSLMGTNWPKCIREAWRILKPEGELKIAEVTSRFTDFQDFENLVGNIGFRLKSKDQSNTHFTLFEFKKGARKPKTKSEWEKVLSRGYILKPCEYKRR